MCLLPDDRSAAQASAQERCGLSIMHALSQVPVMIVDTYGRHSDGKGPRSYRARNVCPGDLARCRRGYPGCPGQAALPGSWVVTHAIAQLLTHDPYFRRRRAINALRRLPEFAMPAG